MSMGPRHFPWKRFLRRRFAAHAEGWALAQIPLFFALYLLHAGQPVDGWYALASLLVSFWLVGIFVGLAALLRFPWWLLTPLCLLSMAVEGAVYARSDRPWPQEAIRRWYLSNPVALWQAWTVRRQRRQRAIARRREHERLQEALRPQPVMASVQSGEGRAATQPKAGERPSAKVLPFPQPIECSAFEYAEAVWEGHFLFWNVLIMLIGWAWLVWAEGMGWLAAGVVEGVLWALGYLLLVLPIALGLLAGLSAWLVGAGLSPVERWRVVESIRAAEASEARTFASAPAATAQPRPASSGWLVPLLLGLWIGSAWGDD
jgi:hypothetical protein